MNIGKEIKVRRTELNLTQEDLAKKLNVSRTAISNWEQ
ncbi:helix-turn-helix transcriptional regulator [Vagococcus fluvialis]|nr:helix-turn-helix transcriptional regulator [Vagococcus fluvialis]